jgi:hypothetical protein
MVRRRAGLIIPVKAGNDDSADFPYAKRETSRGRDLRRCVDERLSREAYLPIPGSQQRV